MQSKSLSETLLFNSQISGVKLQSLSTNLTELGHGLYIESIAQDRYCDLRLCLDKPFWGHTHPLVIQLKYENFSNKELQTKWSVLTSSDEESPFHNFKKITYKEINSSFINEKIQLKLDEFDFLSGIDNQKIADLANENELIIKESDLLLHGNNNIFVSYEIDCPKILSLHFLNNEFFYDQNEDSQITSDQNLMFCEAMQKYYSYLLIGSEKKFEIDQSLILEFITKHKLNWSLKSHYLIISNNNYLPSDFLKEGILINKSNFYEDKIFLAIPVSCTNNELLDTLKRIKSVVKR